MTCSRCKRTVDAALVAVVYDWTKTGKRRLCSACKRRLANVGDIATLPLGAARGPKVRPQAARPGPVAAHPGPGHPAAESRPVAAHPGPETATRLIGGGGQNGRLSDPTRPPAAARRPADRRGRRGVTCSACSKERR